jgi:hypothetical protein
MRVPRKAVLGPESRFHKIWRAHNREFLMQAHEEKRRYLRAIREDYLARCTDRAACSGPGRLSQFLRVAVADRFALYGYCIMSNHAHETGKTGAQLKPLSEHMRRAHGRFGQGYNRRHQRAGKVALDRPRTLHLQDEEALMRAMLYCDCNPVRAGLIKHPTDLAWRGLSSCRVYAFGEESEFSDMLTAPDWYLKLGKTPRHRQSKYRALLDEYMVDIGLKRDPRMSTGYFSGGALWVEEQRRRLRALLRRLTQGPPGQERLPRPAVTPCWATAASACRRSSP